MADNIRDRMKEALKEVPPLGQQITSDGSTAALFTKLTGTSHARMQKDWDNGGIMTACNGFVGTIGNQLGSKEFLGQFEIEKVLKKIGKGEAWVPSTAGVRPKYGDIFVRKGLHMGISLDFEGDVWNTVEAGQGGPKAKRDILMRKKTKYDASALQGWVDIELYFAGPKSPMPDWLLGWWEVTWRNQPYYYFFDRNHKVQWTRNLLRSTSQPPLTADDTGSVTIEDPSRVVITWGKTRSVEKLTKVYVTTAETMDGKWNDKETLKAVKI